MKKLSSMLMIVTAINCWAQKHDNVWIWGYQPPDTLWRGNGQADWFNDTIRTIAKERNTGFAYFSQMYSNAEGYLQYFSNGYRIQDSTNAVIENGDSLNFGPLWSNSTFSGMYIGNSAVQLPMPENDTTSVMVHEIVRSAFTTTDASIAYTIIVSPKTGDQFVSSKNVPVSSIPPSFQNVNACRHGNGRDWWILYSQVNSNCVVKILLTPDTIVEHDIQCLGESILDGDGCHATFSLDGLKYANSGFYSGINVYDFDRCTGELTNHQFIESPLVFDTSGNLVEIFESVKFSPDNQQLYVTMSLSVLQYHLNSPGFPFDKDTVAVADTFIDTIPGHNTVPFIYNYMQYGPDGILYIGPAGNQRYLCTINNPNGIGAACDFRMRSVILPKQWFQSMPNNPNYRLGPLLGSACDTIYNSINESYWGHTPWLKIYPNPAQDEVKLDYNWVEWEKYKSCELRAISLEGNTVAVWEVPKYSSWQVVDVGRLVAGVYTVELVASSKSQATSKQQVVLATGKMVKM